MTSTRGLTATMLILACTLSLGGHQAAAQGRYNPVTNCYDDPAGIAPPFCPGNPGGRGPPGPPPDDRPDTWAAIAISPSTLQWGRDLKRSSQRAAEAGALANCRELARDCVIVKSAYDYCIALSTSPRQRRWWTGGPNMDVRDARAVAINHCQRAGGQGCIIPVSVCADG